MFGRKDAKRKEKKNSRKMNVEASEEAKSSSRCEKTKSCK